MNPFNRVTAIPLNPGNSGDVIFYDGTVFTGDFKAGKGLYYSNGTNWIFMISSNTVGPKVYRATLTQAGLNAPTVTVLENTLGSTPVWSYSATGSYDLTLANAFTADKTFMNAGQYPDVKVNVQRINANVVRVVSSDTTGGVEFPSDGLLLETAFEVKIYP